MAKVRDMGLSRMSRKGNCWGNTVAERFFGSLKQERAQWRNNQTRNRAQQDVIIHYHVVQQPQVTFICGL